MHLEILGEMVDVETLATGCGIMEREALQARGSRAIAKRKGATELRLSGKILRGRDSLV